MNLLLQLVLGGGLIGVTVIIHAIGLDFIMRHAPILERSLRRTTAFIWRPCMAGIIVVGVFAVHIVEIWLWALVYFSLDAAPLQSFSESLYFATVTYTTLGYGDITLGPESRMLSAIEGANGFLLFGWTAAFIFEVISQLYRREAKEL